MKTLNVLLTLLVLGLGAAAVFYVANGGLDTLGGESSSHESEDEHGHEDGGEEEFARGPHGGRLLESPNYDLEITIFETGMPPQFRVYAYRDGKQAPVDDLRLTVDLARHGGRVDTIEFAPEGEYLRGIQVVSEPHSFDVTARSQRGELRQDWTYSSYEGRVEISPEAAEFAGIGIETAGPAVIPLTLTLPGEVKLNAERVVHVVPRLSGLVRSVEKSLGDTVVEGDLLAVVESRELADTKSHFLAARQHLEIARTRYAREKDLSARKVSSQEDFLIAQEAFAEAEIAYKTARQKLMSLGFSAAQIDQISESGEQPLTVYDVRSPIAGIVVEKHITVGEAVADNSDIFMLADLSTVWVEAVVHPKDINRIRVGQDLTMRSTDLDLATPGKVAYIGPVVGEATRTATAIMEVPNVDGLWKPGLFVTVDVIEANNEVPLAVRADAIQTFRDWSVVFVKHGNVYEIAPLELGRVGGEWVEVISGLAAGTDYVAQNSFVIKAEIDKSSAAHEH